MGLGVVAILSNLVPMACQIVLFFLFLFSLVKETKLISFLSSTCQLLCIVDRYFILNFHILTMFDIISLELVRFRNSRYSISSCSFSYSALPFLLLFSYSKIKLENG
jgi:hypothetical protein